MNQSVVSSQVTDQILSDYLKFTGVNLSPTESKMFFDIAKLHNLHPLKKEIFIVKYGSSFNIITGYSVYIQRAELTGQLDGWETWFDESCEDLKAFIKINRKDWSQPFIHSVNFSEYVQQNQLWKTKPKTMLRKVCISQGFRLAFPVQLSTLPYTQDELPDSEIKDVTPKEVTEEKKNDRVINKLYTKIKAHGLSDEEIPDFAKFANFSRDDIDSCCRALNRFNKLFQDYQNSKAIDHESL
ncbi:recombinase RecT [Thiotrichales bacterium 19X7-9]|nr:recombinase RecT [Thiotrichales bacterium 19X7-9]